MTHDDIDLEGLDQPGVVTLNGKRYHVKPIDGYGYRLLAQAKKKDDVEKLDVVYQIAAKCLAGELSRDEVIGTEDIQGLSADDAARVLEAAQAQAEKVEALASPNSVPAGPRSRGT